MAGSVWYPQINKALIGLIPTIVKVYNESRVLVPVPVVYRDPESEYSVETYPSVTISSYDERFDQSRYSDDKVVVSRDLATSTAIVEESAKPYSLFYQIDLWAKYQEDIDLMTMLWASNMQRRNLLDVVDSVGVTRTCCMKLVKVAKSDEVQDHDDRVFHRIYSYEIWVELDENSQEVVPMVTSTPTINNITTDKQLGGVIRWNF